MFRPFRCYCYAMYFSYNIAFGFYMLEGERVKFVVLVWILILDLRAEYKNYISVWVLFFYLIGIGLCLRSFLGM